MPFLPQPKRPAEQWTSKLNDKIIKKHQQITKNMEHPKIRSRHKFRPKFEVGGKLRKHVKTAGVALFFPPTVSHPSWHDALVAKEQVFHSVDVLFVDDAARADDCSAYLGLHIALGWFSAD